MTAPRRWRGLPFVGVLLARDMWRAARRRVRMAFLRHRSLAFRLMPQPEAGVARARVLAVVTHALTPEELRDPARRLEKARTLAACLDGLFRSLAEHDLTVVINTFEDRDVVAALPTYQRARVQVVRQRDMDPMLIEFEVQRLFVDRRAGFDWFMFLEDDILIEDALFIEKVAEFNAHSGDPRALLLPHRYEYNQGRKFYIDRDDGPRFWRRELRGPRVENAVNRLTTISYASGLTATPVSHAEFANPHAAFHCLSRSQLDLWAAEAAGRHGQAVWIGPLETAATGVLLERFDLMKPHPAHRAFLEVRHLTTKYSDQLLARESRVSP